MRTLYLPLLLLLALLLGGCKTRQPIVNTVPIHESTKVEIGRVEIPADSMALRVPFERLSNGGVTSGVAVSKNGMQLLWELKQGMLNIKTFKPPDEVLYPITTTVREIPVEVIKEVTTNHLTRWQTTLMWIGLLAIIASIITIAISRRGLTWPRW